MRGMNRILVVEDEENIADFLVTGLRKGGYAAERAADGVSVGEHLQHESWDLVHLDWRLPGADGLTLLRGFRERKRATPVLFLTKLAFGRITALPQRPAARRSGGVAKRSTALDCKSSDLGLRRFESYPLHHCATGRSRRRDGLMRV